MKHSEAQRRWLRQGPWLRKWQKRPDTHEKKCDRRVVLFWKVEKSGEQLKDTATTEYIVMIDNRLSCDLVAI